MASKDITETGKQSYRQLQEANQEAFTSASQESPFAKLRRPYKVTPQDLIYEGPEQSPLYQQTGGKDYWGNSAFDKGSVNQAEYENLLDTRAQNEPTLIKVANGIIKSGVLAGTTFISGTLGLAAGVAQAIANGVSSDENVHWYEGIFNNPIVQAMSEVNKLSEEYLPNYRTEVEQNRSWWQNLGTANFWFDDVVKNMGFTIGAAFTGGVYSGVISKVARLLGRIKTAGMSEATIQAGVKAMEKATATRHTKALIGSYFNAQAEAVQEAYNSKDDFININTQQVKNNTLEQKDIALQNFIDQGGTLLEDGSPDLANSDPRLAQAYLQRIKDIDDAEAATLKDIELQSNNAGTMTGLLNMPILWLSNIFMFGKMYAGGWKAARNSTKAQVRATKEAYKEAKEAAKQGDPTKLKKLQDIVKRAEQTGGEGLTAEEKALVELRNSHILGKKMGATVAALKGPTREFNEEMLQGAASQAAQYRYSNEVDKIYNARLDIDAEQKTIGLIDAIQYGLSQQYGDLRNWHEGVIGAITGLLGSPTFGRRNNSTDQTYLGKSKWIGMSGGTIVETRDFLRSRRRQDEAAQKVTQAFRSGNLADGLKHLVAQTHFEDVKNRAIIHDDEKEYKDARTASIFEMLSYFRRVGRLDLVKRAAELTTTFTEQEIQDIFEQTSKQVSAVDKDVESKSQKIQTLENDLKILGEEQEQLELAVNNNPDDAELTDSLNIINQKIKDTQQEISQLETQKRFAKGTLVSPYIHYSGDKKGQAFTVDEIKEDIAKRVDNFQKILDTIDLAEREIDNATSESLTDEQLNTLTWYRVMMADWQDRANKITEANKEMLNIIRNTPEMASALEGLQEVEKILKEAGISLSDLDLQTGGRIDSLKQLKNFAQYNTILENLRVLTEQGGIALAYFLSEQAKSKTIKDKTLGEIRLEQLKALVESIQDPTISRDIKDKFIKDLEDLKAIGEGHRRYNELFDEFIKTPSKIETAHQQSEDIAQQTRSRSTLQETSNKINWDAPVGAITRYLQQHSEEIKNAGGFDEFIKNLTPEQQEKIKNAQQFAMQLDALDSLISKSNLEDSHAVQLRKLIDSQIDLVNDPNEFINNLKESINQGKLAQQITESIPEDVSDDVKEYMIGASEEAIFEFLENVMAQLAEALADTEKANQAARDEAIKKKADTQEEVKDDEEAIKKKADTLSDEQKETSGELSGTTPTTSAEVKSVNKSQKKSISPKAGMPGFNRRRQISQYYLNGEDKQSLPDYYEQHQGAIPKGVDKQAFLRYIKAVHKYLVDHKAYDYISTSLNVNETIYFITDKQLNEDAGVPVILMAVKNNQDGLQVIGSLPTSIDFQSKDRSNGKTLGEKNPGDKELYDSLCAELLAEDKQKGTDEISEDKKKVSSITTRVESLKGGNPSTSKQNRSVHSIFYSNGQPIASVPIAIMGKGETGEGGNNAVTNPLSVEYRKKGQVYVYITSQATGVQIPMLCFSTPLKDLNIDDWYIQETIAAIQQCAKATNIGSAKMKVIKQLPFIENLSVNIIEQGGGKSLLFSWGPKDAAGHPVFKFSMKIQQDGSVSAEDAFAFIKKHANHKITTDSGEKVYPTTNVDYNRINDSSYVENITKYIFTDITPESPFTIDDWFTYEATPVQRRNEPRPSTRNPVVPPPSKNPSTTPVETNDGAATVSSAGTVTPQEGGRATNAQAEQARQSAATKGQELKDGELPKSNPLLSSSDEGPTITIDTKRRPKRRGPNSSAKPLLTQEVQGEKTATIDQTQKSIETVSKMFPQLGKAERVVLVKGLITIVDKKGNPQTAYGMFRNGVLYISNQAPKGTAYHEAFHYVVDTLLTEVEKTAMFKEAAELFGNNSEIFLEEQLAEKFRAFMNDLTDNSIKGKIKSLFIRLKHIIKTIAKKESYIDSLFWSIYRNNLKDRKDNTAEETYKQELIKFKHEQLQYSNLDQETRDYLEARKISQQEFDNLSIEQKEMVLQCM